MTIDEKEEKKMSNDLIVIKGERDKEVFTRIKEMVRTFPISCPELVKTGLKILSLACSGPKHELIKSDSDFLAVIEEILYRIEEVSSPEEKLSFLSILKDHLNPSSPSFNYSFGL